ncbi:DUF881 domain-containing protein [Bacillus sp. V3B]|uniref:DUF881 domain-containing protein n=1 Tax=Bacillus sp. V3B TaxID=2804915 RepID=UPI002109608F|nr:DUF881 domain-containing protein [Bacillus sp. V3B]MCQ6274007.1 DUF881 domain-containing protein [Bacillus sp. V3B]
MGNKKYISMAFITLIIGFMVAIQFQTVKEPVVRDTRDTWQLREDLVKEKELQLNLIREIRSNEEKLDKYKTERVPSKEQILKDTLNELKVAAGLTEVEGPGIIISIEPSYEELLLGEIATPISPYLIQTLINELNQYGAAHISIDDHRLINTTVIRDINGETKVDGYPLNHLPIVVKVAVDHMDEAQNLYNRMQVSKLADDFFIDNYRLSISEPQLNVMIPAYKDTIRIRYMELVGDEKGG